MGGRQDRIYQEASPPPDEVMAPEAVTAARATGVTPADYHLRYLYPPNIDLTALAE
jgi:hypothetical protein